MLHPLAMDTEMIETETSNLRNHMANLFLFYPLDTSKPLNSDTHWQKNLGKLCQKNKITCRFFCAHNGTVFPWAEKQELIHRCPTLGRKAIDFCVGRLDATHATDVLIVLITCFQLWTLLHPSAWNLLKYRCFNMVYPGFCSFHYFGSLLRQV